MSVLVIRGLRLRLLFISRFRGLLPYSTAEASTTQCERKTYFMVDYLINSLGLSREEAISTSAMVKHFKSTEKPDSVINFFKQNGFEKTHIKNVITSFPRLLSINVEKHLKPKFKFLQDIGLSESDLVKVISGFPKVFHRSLDTHMVPSINYLKEVLGNQEDVVKAIRQSIWMLSCNLRQKMPPNVLLLKEYGLSDKNIKRLIIWHPRYLIHKPEWLEEVLRRVEVELAIPHDSPMFFHGISALASNTKSSIEIKSGIFKSFGWSDSDIKSMARRLPYCLSLSEAKIRTGLNFYMKDLEFLPEYLASHPNLLMHSLERRVVPRNEILKILKERKLVSIKVSLYSVVRLTEAKFVQDFLLPYKSELPDFYEAHIK